MPTCNSSYVTSNVFRLDYISERGSSPDDPDAPRPLAGPLVPHNLMSSLGSPVRVLKFPMAPRLRLLTSSGFSYALFPLGPESSPKNITFFCNYSINNGLVA